MIDSNAPSWDLLVVALMKAALQYVTA